MINAKIICLNFIFFIAVTCSIRAQSLDPNLASSLQRALDSLRVAANVKGISAGVFYPGHGEWRGTSGISHSSVSVLPDMEFGIGSNTKLFTAVSLLKLYENNIISLNDSVGRWLSPITNVNPAITIRQLLNHTSGIADIIDYPGYADSILSNPSRLFTPEELLPWIGPPLFPPGSSGSYSNSNYLLAGMIFEAASGMDIGDFIRDSILTPLNMDSTFFDVHETVLGTIAHPWQNGLDISGVPRVSLNSAAWTAGAMYSNTGDMLQWYRSVFQDSFLSASAFAEMTAFAGPGHYGLGVGQQVLNGRVVWGHGGDIRGYRSRMVMDTSLRVIIAVLTNTNPLDVNVVASGLLDLIVNHPVEIGDHEYTRPPSMVLLQNYPNPFNPSTVISYRLTADSRVKLKIYNALGQEVRMLVNGFETAGIRQVMWDGKDALGNTVGSGVYLYRLDCGGFTKTMKMTILK